MGAKYYVMKYALTDGVREAPSTARLGESGYLTSDMQDLFPDPRGVVCTACRGRGRLPEPTPWNENDTPEAARRRGAGVVPREIDLRR